MSDQLYSDAIKKLAKLQRRDTPQSPLTQVDAKATLDNPLCGDRVTVQLTLAQGHISQVDQQVRGCLLCNAAAHLLGDLAIGCNLIELERGQKHLEEYLDQTSANLPPAWQQFAIFEPAKDHKNRHSCITLPMAVMVYSLQQATQPAT